jgi:hypothetical protein
VKFPVETGYLAPIEMGEHEYVTVILPDGRSVTVFSDCIYIATGKDRGSHEDGRRIWDAGSPSRSPYGLVRSKEDKP